MSSYRRLDQLERRLEGLAGELLERHRPRPGALDLRKYRGRTVGRVQAFCREILKLDLHPQQLQIVALYCGEQRFAAVRSGVSLGKTWAAAAITLYALYVERAMVLTLGASDRQVRELMWQAIRRLWSGSNLPGEMFQQYLRVNEATGQVAVGFVTSDEGRLRGWHHPRLLCVIDEAAAVPSWTWDGVMALLTGQENRCLAVGNAGTPAGRWYDLHRGNNSAWAKLTLSALDHVNITSGTEVVPGGPSRAWLAQVRAEYGEESGYYRGLILGEFASEEGEQLIEAGWLDRAEELWQSGALEHQAREGHFAAALDIARFGNDSCVLMLRRGPVLRGIAQWRKADLMVTVDKTVQQLAAWGVRVWPYQAPAEGAIHPEEMWKYAPALPENVPLAIYGNLPEGRLAIDTVGLGSGPHDVMKRRRFRVDEFVSSQAAREPERFANRRAEATWGLSRLLQDGALALPPHEELRAELLGLTWQQTGGSGKILIGSKLELRSVLGRSPDHGDALVMVAEDLIPQRRGGVGSAQVRYG